MHQADVQHVVLRRRQFLAFQRFIPQCVGVLVLHFDGGQGQLLHWEGQRRRLARNGHNNAAFGSGRSQCKGSFLCREIDKQRRQLVDVQLGLLFVGQGFVGRVGLLHLPGQLRAVGIVSLGVIRCQQLLQSGFHFLRTGQCIDQRRHFLHLSMLSRVVGIAILGVGMLRQLADQFKLRSSFRVLGRVALSRVGVTLGLRQITNQSGFHGITTLVVLVPVALRLRAGQHAHGAVAFLTVRMACFLHAADGLGRLRRYLLVAALLHGVLVLLHAAD